MKNINKIERELNRKRETPLTKQEIKKRNNLTERQKHNEEMKKIIIEQNKLGFEFKFSS